VRDGVIVGLELGVLERQLLGLVGELLLQAVQLQMMLDARQQLLALDRLGDVVHRAQRKALDLVRGVVHAVMKNHRDRRSGGRVRLQAATDLEAVHVRHPQVSSTSSGGHAGAAQRLRAAAGEHQLEALLGQEVGNQPQVLRLVVHDQERGAAQLSR
jgi:hypothetical protein